ncbi:MAG TPA: cation transporter [bacterium]|nr:cation transporter [bacterium]HQG44158.1 cation transporter [bacterium]HQI49840.1 cation transporter [bacterium]HQJ64876.1 cation transporter [bacterium]
MEEERFTISGMSCMHCVAAVKRALETLGLTVVEVALGSARVRYDEHQVSRAQIVAAIEEAGYQVV